MRITSNTGGRVAATRSGTWSPSAAHHLIGIHKEYIDVWGKAPDELTWEGIVRPGPAPDAQAPPRESRPDAVPG